MSYPEIKVIKNNPDLTGMAAVIPDVIFSKAAGVTLKMQLLVPWNVTKAEKSTKRFPLIVFVQGSAWTYPDVYAQIPQLCAFSRAGYVVATVTHRNSLEGHPFPGFLQDVKTAIRFLRKNADTYRIDTDRVGIWGTSSGGNTALFVGLTSGDKRFITEEYPEYSDEVNLVVDCFGPSDLCAMLGDGSGMDAETTAIFKGLAGGDMKDIPAKLRMMSPVLCMEKEKKYPPFLLLHGDRDTMVPYSQSEDMFHKLVDAGISASMVRVEGAPHEGSFWSQELLDLIKEFIDNHIGQKPDCSEE